MKIFLDNGYLDMHSIIRSDYNFVLICGPRGTGKTYGALKDLIENNERFIFMRRTQQQIELIDNPEFSPFKPINEDLGTNIYTFHITKTNSGIYRCNPDSDGKVQKDGSELIGFTVALSTISNMRGFDASMCDYMIYDEFIPERHERRIKNEAAALFNAYETIARNRELKGKKAMKLICLANSNELANPLFIELKLVQKAEQMRRKGQQIYEDRKRGLLLIILNGSPISQKKSDTALYRLTGGTEFREMAIDNAFQELKDDSSVKSMPLMEYRPICQIGEVCCYQHKSNGTYYVSLHCSGSPKKYGTSDTEKARWRRAYQYLWFAYLRNDIIFENSTSEILFENFYLGT